jgi:hypothetical protein
VTALRLGSKGTAFKVGTILLPNRFMLIIAFGKSKYKTESLILRRENYEIKTTVSAFFTGDPKAAAVPVCVDRHSDAGDMGYISVGKSVIRLIRKSCRDQRQSVIPVYKMAGLCDDHPFAGDGNDLCCC